MMENPLAAFRASAAARNVENRLRSRSEDLVARDRADFAARQCIELAFGGGAK